MRRTHFIFGGFLQNLTKGKENFFTSLWNKPDTRDDRIKDYIPEVMEESLLEEKAVRLENNSRDVIVELGHKIILEIEKKSPTSRIAPHLSKLLKEYGTSSDLICQRPLSYLIYPTSSILSSNAEASHDLVLNFADNFRGMIEEIEKSGCSAKRTKSTENSSSEGTKEEVVSELEENPSSVNSSDTGDATIGEKEQPAGEDGAPIVAADDEYEPLDITLFVKVTAGMALANLNCGDLRYAEKCVDAALLHAKDPQRVGGLYGMKAGILCRQKKFEAAVEAAKKAISASQNLQGFLQGSYALNQLNRKVEEVELLEEAKESHPMNQQIAQRLSEAQKSLPEPLLQLDGDTK